MNEDMALVREYAACQSEQAFERLITRHVGLVHSAALRQVRDPHLAEEVTQSVFILLARKAGSLNQKTILPGWLYRTTRYVATAASRKERLRERYEQEICMEASTQPTQADSTWEELAPWLDEAMAHLRDKDRDAVVLRYFQNKSLREVGTMLGVNEYTAQKRVSRAVEKLRAIFARRGVISTTAIISGAIAANSVQAAPVALAKSVTAVAVAKGAAAGGSTLTLIKGALKLMVWTKAKSVGVGLGILLVAGTGVVVVKNDLDTREPSYEGRGLTEWLVDVDYNQPNEKRSKAGGAIRHMGAKTLPFLLADLGDERFQAYSRKRDQRTPDQRSRQAAWAFDALGPVATSAIPELERIMEKNPGYVPGALAGIGRDALPELLSALTNQSFSVRDNTAAAIANAVFSGKITPQEASAAFPIAVANLSYVSTNSLFQVNTRWRAADLLVALRQSPDISVPVLIRGLEDSNASVAARCAFALAQFGNKAKAAIPALTKAAGSTNAQLRMSAKQSLDRIEKGQ